MRRITFFQVLVFFSLFLGAVALSLGTIRMVSVLLPAGDFKGIALTAAGVVFFYVYAIAIYRIFLMAMPLPEGSVAEKSRDEFVSQVYLLFYLILFCPVMRSGLAPIPLMRVFYLMLGAKLGDNTYSSGILYDPNFIEIGSNTIVGQSAILIPHVIEGRRLEYRTIRIGSNVTIGAQAVVLAGATIEDNAIVAVGAVVCKGAHILQGEVWGGVPARRIKAADPDTQVAVEQAQTGESRKTGEVPAVYPGIELGAAIRGRG